MLLVCQASIEWKDVRHLFCLPGFNRVEGCTAPLLHDHSGLILTHDSFGNHLGENMETIDIDLEIRNFFKTAEVLYDVWSKTVINGHPVNCVAVPVGQSYEPPIPEPTWVTEHVQQSRDFLQIVKCFGKRWWNHLIRIGQKFSRIVLDHHRRFTAMMNLVRLLLNQRLIWKTLKNLCFFP